MNFDNIYALLESSSTYSTEKMLMSSSIAIILAVLLRSSESHPLNTTRCISQPNAAACQSVTTAELVTKLDACGGYNKRYQAISKVEARTLSNFLKNSMIAAVSEVQKSRGRRESSSHINETTVVSVAQRGSLDEYGFRRLCTEQYALTTLPADHFPRYLNEVICDSTDQWCLDYDGVCVQGSFVVNVLKNSGACGPDGKENWNLLSLPVRTGCDCRLIPS